MKSNSNGLLTNQSSKDNFDVFRGFPTTRGWKIQVGLRLVALYSHGTQPEK